MEPELRKHTCSLGIDYDRKFILCCPEPGKDHVVLTTPALYAWHAHNLTTSEGMRHWVFMESAGYLGKDFAIKLLQEQKIVFVGCKEIFASVELGKK